MTDSPAGRDAVQRKVAALLLSVIGDDGFALAGASAIREHALTDRPTEDIDLFGMPLTTAEEFARVVQRAETTLSGAGYTVVRARSFAQFARLHLSDGEGDVLDVDLALNWRADPPVHLDVGPVLSERDAIAGKLSAVYSRGEVRDFLDLDAIRTSCRYTDAELLGLGREHDDGFDTAMFAAQLSRVATFLPSEPAHYGVSADDFAGVQERLLAWAVHLRDGPERASDVPSFLQVEPRQPEPHRRLPPRASTRRPGRPGPFDDPFSPQRREGPSGPERRGFGR